jgi:hypothetical protein
VWASQHRRRLTAAGLIATAVALMAREWAG